MHTSLLAISVGRSADLVDLSVFFLLFFFFFFQAEDGIRDAQESRGLGELEKW